MRAAFSKGAGCRERLAAVFTAVSGEWAERFGACVRCFGPRLAIAILFVVANAIFGCSAQHARQYQYSSPGTYRSYSPVPPGSRVEVASWYGPGFAGHSTSTGETFNPNELTAASKTLPIGSRVRVINPDNGRSVVVRINDRGPFVRGRSLDLSHRAAREIGLTAKGVGRVQVSAAGATSYDAPAYQPLRPRPAQVSYASNEAPPVYIRNTTYYRRTRQSSRRRRVSNPIGAWLASAWPF
jgi:rare lipoprotein A (peptidoglycan hydrolase)